MQPNTAVLRITKLIFHALLSTTIISDYVLPKIILYSYVNLRHFFLEIQSP